MGLRRAVRVFQVTSAAWGHPARAWGQQQPLNSQQHAAQRYLHLILARLCPGTHGCAGGGGATAAALAAAAGGRAALSTASSSRLYPKAARFTPEDAAFWGIIALNAAAAAACKAEAPGAREFVLTHMRTSVEAIAGGRLHTLLTCVPVHYSAVHCAINLALLAAFRRVQPLGAAQLLTLYVLGGAAGAAAHVGFHWYDAGGPTYGTKYALNTPAFFGCSGGVAAVTAFKAARAPAAMAMVGGMLPVPILFALGLFCATEVKEPEYCDGYPAKLGGAALGALLALAAVATRGRARPPA
ncbi:MAG: hypothetical protein J3K34DRAFT_93200 [Monoraphidium minutum]|nr:MAG: hypothetical protein J3K34DRAFT_93200 [Monoraphidium minutum]